MDNNNEIIESFHIANVRCDAVFKQITLTYSNPVGLFMGKVCIAQYVLDGTVSNENPKKYKVTTKIHSINNDLGHFATEKECRERCLSAALVFTNQLSGK